MKNKTTLLVICFLVALAQAEVTNWAGNWDIQPTPSDAYCYPANTIFISQAVGSITASWVWANSQACKQAKIAGQQFTQTVDTPEGNAIAIKVNAGGAVIDGTFTVTQDTAVFASNNGASSSYSRRKQLVNWPGKWDIVTQDPNACNPDGTIIITQTTNYVWADWTWANSKACIDAGLAGKGFEGKVATPSGNAVALSFSVGSVAVQGIFAVIHDQAVFASVNGASATFVRRQELVNWVGTWDVKSIYSSSACYPDEFVTIIPNGGSLTASWIWGNTNACQYVGLAGKSFTQTQEVPKGNAIFLDFFVGEAYVSGLFTVSDDSSAFISATGASATFTRRDQMVSWGGVFDIAKKDTTVCYPDGSITVAQTASDLTVSWVWAKTTPCSNLALGGEKFSKTLDIPSGNKVSLDVSSSNTTISGLLTLFLDGAVFSSTNGASSTYTRRQENVEFAGTWTLQTTISESSCYPDTSIKIAQGSGKLTAEWTWADSVACNYVGLAKTTFSQTVDNPRGKAIFLDIIVGKARISGLFTANGENAVFASNNGASATFLRTSKPTSWTFIIIALVVVIALAVAGYYFYMQHKNKKLQGENLDNSVSGSYTKA